MTRDKSPYLTDNGLFHYKNCGLDYVYLANGFEIKETPYGNGYTIHDADQLHEMIAISLVTQPMPIRGQEFRFLRSHLDCTQAEMAKLIGITRARVAQIEAAADDKVSGSVDRAIRYYVAGLLCGQEAVKNAIKSVKETDLTEEMNIVFTQSDDHHWRAQAA